MADVFDEVYTEIEETEAIQIASETLLGDLIAATLDEIKAAPDVWQKLSESKQADVIERLERRVADCVEQVVHIIASADRPTIRARLDQLTTKDAIKAVCVVSRKDPGGHDLLDSVGEEVLIVLPHAEQYTEQPSGIEPDPDQPGLALADDDDQDPLLDEAIQFVRVEGKCSISQVQRKLKIGYNRAARLVETMERLGIVSEIKPNGSREVYAGSRSAGKVEDVLVESLDDDAHVHFDEALEVLEHVNQCSAETIAKDLCIDDESAARTIEVLERRGLVSKANGDGIRQVITEKVDELIDSMKGRGGDS